MTTSKQTLDQYNQTREEWREKLQPLFDEKNKRREALKIAFADEPERAKREKKLMRTKLNDQWKEYNKDLIIKYQELYNQKKLDEVTFQKWLEEFRKWNPEIDEQSLRDLFYGKKENKESKETEINIPSDVATQEKKAIAYFDKNNEVNHLKIVDHIKKLREEWKITYEDLGWGKYAVIMPCWSKKLKMYFPADTSLSDSSYNYIDWDDKEITIKETTRIKLWSKELKKYLEQKEKEWQKLLSESEFKSLIQSLYPEWTEQEQILAFMMATWFYGRMRLSDKTSNYQRAVKCARFSDDRYFCGMDFDDYECSLVHSTFVG